MPKMIPNRTFALRTAACSLLAAVVGCVAHPATISERIFTADITDPSTLQERYGAIDQVTPHKVDPILPGQSFTLPQGRSAVTVWVKLPVRSSKAADASPVLPGQHGTGAPRSAQYIDFGTTTRVVITVSGEGLPVPQQTTVNVNGSSTAAATLLLLAGRNQIITADAYDAQDRRLATIQGVVSTEAGKVIQAHVRYGTTPMAQVLTSLPTALAPQVNTSAISAVIDPVTAFDEGSGTYAVHPLYIDHQSIARAIESAVNGGTDPASLSAEAIRTRLGDASLVLPGSTLSLNFIGPDGEPYDIRGRWYAEPTDQDGDGLPDGANYLSRQQDSTPVVLLQCRDPLSPMVGGNWASPYSGTNPARIQIPVPPGSFSILAALSSPGPGGVAPADYWMRGAAYSHRPWVVPPLSQVDSGHVPILMRGIAEGTLEFIPGATTDINIAFTDVSTPIQVASGSAVFQMRAFQWLRLDTEANKVYHFHFEGTGTPLSAMGEGQTIGIHDREARSVWFSRIASDSYTWASPATNSLYIHNALAEATLGVVAASLEDGKAGYNLNVNFVY